MRIADRFRGRQAGAQGPRHPRRREGDFGQPGRLQGPQAAAPPEGETKILGYDAAGIVDAVGPDVTLFKPGDEVFYAGWILRQGTNWDLIWSTSASSAASRNR